MADGVYVFGYGNVARGVADAAGAVLRDEVGGDEDGIGMGQEEVWVVCGGVEELYLLPSGSTRQYDREGGQCKGSQGYGICYGFHF